MENASKALLIAAAVLIVILLIAFGMKIFNSTGDTTSQADTTSSTTSMQTFNAQFSGFLGNNISTSTVRSLLLTIKNSNAANTSHKIDTDPTTVTLEDGKVYKVTVANYDENQYIIKIKIETVATGTVTGTVTVPSSN